FDEPLTVIDPHMKWQVRRKLKEIHKQFGHTLVYVTHDQNEALTFADKVVVMSDGEIVQVGTPQELFEQPAHRFVGYFIGSPGMNFLPCSLVADGLGIDGTEIVLGDVWAARAREKPDSKLELGIRPEFLDVVGEDSGDSVPVQILKVENLGNFQLITVGLGPHAMMVRVPEDRPVPDGFGHMRFDPAMTKLYTDGRLAA
ncbi:MAG: ABC transporter ATP-binding protein, partial [Geminicoccaceae bacterium]|nr:ABC transporter ATP-binding protein [Geminicoccaceae bacterium]